MLFSFLILSAIIKYISSSTFLRVKKVLGHASTLVAASKHIKIIPVAKRAAKEIKSILNLRENENTDSNEEEGERQEGERREGERQEGEQREGERREGEQREGAPNSAPSSRAIISSTIKTRHLRFQTQSMIASSVS